jgi:hypothetical protein
MTTFSNRNLMIVVIYFIGASVALSIIAALRGCKIYKDGWFIPILVAQLWTAIVGLNRGDYNN